MKQIPDTARRHHVNRASPVRRPVLPRAQPIRNFSGVFGGRRPDQDGGTPAPAAAKNDKRGSKGRGKGTAKGKGSVKKPTMPAPAAAVARGVNAGYRVIEEYLRQGQEFARTLWPGSAGAGSRTSTSSGGPDAPMNMTERLIRSASDLAGLFSEFLQTFSLPGTLPAPGSTPIPDFGLGRAAGPVPAPRPGGGRTGSGNATGTEGPDTTAPTDAAATTISLDLRSRRRTEVTANLRPHSSSARLQVHDLRPSDGAKNAKAARLTGVTATAVAPDHRMVIAVEVPDALPAGTYSGLIVDADSNLPRGTLSIKVFPDPRPAPARKTPRRSG